ncbi:MAG: GLPGLI family protein [Winogradskyella sp.]|uniref:GLPGLI family protein n=1 Tax=Winogradskyella sp. TaxID=1883156 RepID=UPI000F3F3428|nr:GLPGLI family protein [Winogradskyella sp.]RNC84213.1 MAG: GLPGLI family protein [Winogradskyella sp.]
MKSLTLKLGIICILFSVSFQSSAQEFVGKAYYFSKSTMDLGRWGARFSEAQKKQIMARMKNRLEKTYVLSFNKTESFFKEDEKLDAMSGATDSWGKNFAQGDQYKNVKDTALVQTQEFYGKKFLVKDKLQKIDWKLGSETKQIGNYTCFKAMALIPSDELSWYNFSWDKLRRQEPQVDSLGNAIEPELKMTQVEAWYTPQVPVNHGPSEFWGLPGLILEISADNNTMLCSKIVINPKETIKIEAPKRGEEINKLDYQATIVEKMKDFRNNRGGRRRG